jgi:hypothetical protein
MIPAKGAKKRLCGRGLGLYLRQALQSQAIFAAQHGAGRFFALAPRC